MDWAKLWPILVLKLLKALAMALLSVISITGAHCSWCMLSCCGAPGSVMQLLYGSGSQ
jgi:hypothetical protein